MSTGATVNRPRTIHRYSAQNRPVTTTEATTVRRVGASNSS